ncbi:LPS-assembly protein LptD [Algiphilus sp.]|uniref:LPS-assembly protein LptD n=1 Tax=Algiphilus sp. TaxID=1872431 RepID=UPI003BA9059D
MQGFRPPILAAAWLVCWSVQAVAAPGQCVQPLPEDAPALGGATDGIQLDADAAELIRDGLSTLRGDVRLSDGRRAFQAERLRFDTSRRLVEIDSRSQFREEGLYVSSDGMRFDIDKGTGTFEQSQIVLSEARARAGAERMVLSEAGTATLSGVRYTTCAPDSRAWSLQAAEIELDRASGLGTATHARLRVFDVPVLYLPWLQFPLDNARRTGWLYPSIGTSSRNGMDISWPLYVNLAPNYDLQIDPRWLTRRGLQMGSTFRYLGEHRTASLEYEYLGNDQRTDEDRAYGRLRHRGLINDRLSLDIDYAEVSDSAYFDDLGSELNESALTFLPRELRMVYNAPAEYTAIMRISSFQTLDPSLARQERPYRRLPQLRFIATTPGRVLFTRAGLDARYVNFDADSLVEGQRYHLNPYLRTFVDRNGWFAGTRVEWRYTGYDLRNAEPGQPDHITRSLPSISAETGLRFDRRTEGGNRQTLEPQLFYLHTPFRNQDRIPVFDSGETDFDIIQLFANNRFSGIDRIADANQLAAAVTSRLLDADSGDVRWSATIGQLVRFERSRVTLDGIGAAPSGVTDVITAFDYRLSRRITAEIATLWSPENTQFNRTLSRLRFDDSGRRASIAYRYRRDQLEQADLQARWPVVGGLALTGRWRTSLRFEQSLETLAGVSYDSCCWSAQLMYRRHIATNDGEFDSGVLLQFQLKGLGGFGSSNGGRNAYSGF